MLSLLVLGVLVTVGLVGGVYAAGSGAAPAKSDATVRITVKASEFKFALSRRSVPVGTTVVFTVVNSGKILHDFKIHGKKTPILAPGKKATLTVKFSKKGKLNYVCTLVGHTGAGMKGVFAVGVAAPKVTTTTTTRTTTTTTTTTPGGPIGTANTTVRVDMFEYRFDMSQQSIPSGQVTFVITNKGGEVHNFAIAGGRSGALLPPGGTETWTVGLPAGGYSVVCDVPFHIERGMTSSMTITP